MQELAWLLINDLNYEKAKSINQFYRAPFIEFGNVGNDDSPNIFELEQTGENSRIFMKQSYKYATKIMKDPRLIKTHLPIQLLSPQIQTEQKIIYVARNLKDVCVSFYHMKNCTDEFKEFALAFKNGDLGPGNWPLHIKDAWTRKDQKNICFVWYEEMKQDLDSVIDKVAEFLEITKLTSEKRDELKSYLHIDNFRNNTAVNKVHEMRGKTNFIRKGIVGDHKNYFDEVMEKDWDEWFSKEFNGTGIKMN